MQSQLMFATSIVIPSPEEAICKAVVIAVGEFKEGEDDVFIVEERLKGPANLPKELIVYYPFGFFSVSRWRADLHQEQTIFLGKMIPEYGIIIPMSTGLYGFWPQGPKPGYLAFHDIDQLKEYIKQKLATGSTDNASMVSSRLEDGSPIKKEIEGFLRARAKEHAAKVNHIN